MELEYPLLNEIVKDAKLHEIEGVTMPRKGNVLVWLNYDIPTDILVRLGKEWASKKGYLITSNVKGCWVSNVDVNELEVQTFNPTLEENVCYTVLNFTPDYNEQIGVIEALKWVEIEIDPKKEHV